MINIQILSQQPLTCVDLIPARTKNTHLLFGFDFNTVIKDEKETHPINRFMDRFIWLTRRYVLNNSAIIKKLSLKELVNDLKEDMHNDVLFNIQEFQKKLSQSSSINKNRKYIETRTYNFRTSQKYKLCVSHMFSGRI